MFGLFKKKNKETGPIGFEPDEYWKNIVIKGINQYDSLTKSERIWYNIRGIIDSTNSGGLISYYYNSGAENVYDTIDDLKSLGFDNIAGFIESYNKILFKSSDVPKDVEDRNQIINNLDEQTYDHLQNLEIKLSNLIDDLESQLEIFLYKEKLVK